MTSLYSHVALCCVNVIKQGLYRHPFNRYPSLENRPEILLDFILKIVVNKYTKMYNFPPLYLAPLYIRVLFVHVSGKAKVWDLHLSSFSYEDVSCRKVPVDELSEPKCSFHFSAYTQTTFQLLTALRHFSSISASFNICNCLSSSTISNVWT